MAALRCNQVAAAQNRESEERAFHRGVGGLSDGGQTLKSLTQNKGFGKSSSDPGLIIAAKWQMGGAGQGD